MQKLIRIINEAIGRRWQSETTCVIDYIEDPEIFNYVTFESVVLEVGYNWQGGSRATRFEPGESAGIEDCEVTGIAEFTINVQSGKSYDSEELLQHGYDQEVGHYRNLLLRYINKHFDRYAKYIEECCAEDMQNRDISGEFDDPRF